MINLGEETLASIVTRHQHAATILEKHHLDFCCKGKRTLYQACNEKGIMIEPVITDLKQATENNKNIHNKFDLMNAENLIHYILAKHHSYVKQAMPSILSHLEKVSAKHGKSFPNMILVFEIFSLIKEELNTHMFKEEEMLFPRIKELEYLFTHKINIAFPDSYINDLLAAMELEHHNVGALLIDIVNLSNDYAIPKEACMTFKVVLEELKYFEEDLHKHIHLENNVLFPLVKNMVFN